MPYIKSKERREKLRNGNTAQNAGELNYQLFYYYKHYNTSIEILSKIEIAVKNFLGDKPNYQKYNDLTGVLVRCHREINRRLKLNAKCLLDLLNSYDKEIANYEDKKRDENGDVE